MLLDIIMLINNNNYCYHSYAYFMFICSVTSSMAERDRFSPFRLFYNFLSEMKCSQLIRILNLNCNSRDQESMIEKT